MQSSALADTKTFVGTWLSEEHKCDIFGFVHEFCKLIRENRPPTPKLQEKLTGDFLRYCFFGPFPHACRPDKRRLSAIKAMLKLDYRLHQRQRGEEDESTKKQRIERLVETMLDAIIVRCVLMSKPRGPLQKQLRTLESSSKRQSRQSAEQDGDSEDS